MHDFHVCLHLFVLILVLFVSLFIILLCIVFLVMSAGLSARPLLKKGFNLDETLTWINYGYVESLFQLLFRI